MLSLLDLPTEIRIRIYSYVLDGVAFRPQRTVGWNRPSADLTIPALLFANHYILSRLFNYKQAKPDHALILTCLLKNAKVLVVDHKDFTSLQKLSSTHTPSLTLQARTNALAVQSHLRTLDFSDKFDDVLCQPADVQKLLTSLPALRTIHLTSRHPHRYRRSIDAEIELARTQSAQLDDSGPVTDGTKMYVQRGIAAKQGGNFVAVDLSMLVWQHFLFSGAPYRDHWRAVKMQRLLDAAGQRGVAVVLTFRNLCFLPGPAAHGPGGERFGAGCAPPWACAFRGEMSTRDWLLRLQHRGGHERYAVRQRVRWDEPVEQDSPTKLRCRHNRTSMSHLVNCC